MINNKLKIKDSKTEFIVFRSPQAKQDLSGLSVIVGNSIIQQSSKVRNLGIIFDQFLSFDDYISYVCWSTHFFFFFLRGRFIDINKLLYRIVEEKKTKENALR